MMLGPRVAILPSHDIDRTVAGKLRRAIDLMRGMWLLSECRCSEGVAVKGMIRVDARRNRIRIHDRCTFMGGPVASELICRGTGSIVIGSTCILNYGASLIAEESIILGDRCMFGSYVTVHDRFADRRGPVVIEDDVWVAHGAVIEPGVRIGARSVVSARSRVERDIPPDSLAIGRPARILPLHLIKRSVAESIQ